MWLIMKRLVQLIDTTGVIVEFTLERLSLIQVSQIKYRTSCVHCEYQISVRVFVCVIDSLLN